jgi:hypothetical protein
MHSRVADFNQTGQNRYRNSVMELIDYVRSRRGQLNVAVAGLHSHTAAPR